MISDLLPNLAELADEMCFIHSMTARSNTHGPGENQMSTGFTLDGFPSVGAWVSYALGSVCDNLPAFVAIPDPRGVPQVGPNNWGAAFLPTVFQGTAFNAQRPIPHLARPAAVSQQAERASDANRLKAGFARNCILARRLLERNVRFVQLCNGSYAMGEGVGNWDGHRTIVSDYNRHAPIFDQPCAALLRDLKQRDLLDETLVVWVTEFGRMPTFQRGAQGRDHNPNGFTVWLAGAGVKHGFSYGVTDEFGYRAAHDICTIYDLHATILHLLGLDHERLSYYHNGIERRLTDVHGHVIDGVLAS
jgi:hypothetical protein